MTGWEHFIWVSRRLVKRVWRKMLSVESSKQVLHSSERERGRRMRRARR